MRYTYISQQKGALQQCTLSCCIGRGPIARSGQLPRLRELIPDHIYRPQRCVLLAAIPIGVAGLLGLCVYPSLVAQTTAPPPTLASLKTVAVPGPSEAELAVYVRDKKAAIQLGKALFWDTKVGSDNRTACASCHFQAGADNRITNQINPGLLAGDRTFQLGSPNYTLKTANLRAVQEALGSRIGRDIFMYSMTVNPEYDTDYMPKSYAKTFDVGKGWSFLTGPKADTELIRRKLGFFNSDPEIDEDLTQHTGMVRIGNDKLNRWCMMPGMLSSRQIAYAVKNLS